MTYTKHDLLEYVKENDVKFVKLTFCDLLGRQRNISVLSSQLEDAFENGVAIDSAAMTGVGGVDLKLIPISSLLSDLPWRPHSGRVVSVFCKVTNADCSPYACDSMTLLEERLKKLSTLGLEAEVATECEFYVFKDQDSCSLEPIDSADYCACSPFDKCENLRRDVILSLEDMGLKPISSHHERGKGQNEIDFEKAEPAASARNFVMFKAAVKNVCSLNGTRASFMPKPMSDQPGSGLHLAITLKGKNASEAVTKAFAEGVLRRYRDISCFANPTLNSYKRLGKGYPIAYGSRRGRAMRLFDGNVVQLRTPDSTCNLFAVLALVFSAGMEGIEGKYKLREEGAADEKIFDSIIEAIEYAKRSKWLHANIPDQLNNLLDSMTKRATAAMAYKTDKEFFEFYSDV